jgi:universal stress protein A
MSSYKHILVPTDFSKPSETAAARAAALAKACGAQLSVLHVVDYVPPGYVRSVVPDAEESDLVERARTALADWVKRLALTPANQWVVVGPAKREILTTAQEKGIDLIVLGSHGERGLGRLLGSTTNAVIHEASCDALSVRTEP